MYSLLVSLTLTNLLYFALHLTSSGSFPRPLTAKEERECLLQIKEGDPAARDCLVEHNLRLVAHIVKKYYSGTDEPDDLISIGTIGLIKAVSTFDCDKNVRFSTYAARCIENEILMYFRSKRKSSQDVSFSDPIDMDKDGNALTLQDVMSEESNVLEDIDLRLKSEQLHQLLQDHLSRREQEILTMRYGLKGTMPLTQREVATKLGISRSYVSRIEKRAIATLKKQFAELGQTEY